MNGITAKIEDLLPYKAPAFLGRLKRRVRYQQLRLFSGKKVGENKCSVCKAQIAGFVHGGKLCVFCTAFPRHRALLPLIEKWVEAAESDVKLMHVAPDACMRAQLLEHRKLKYMGIDRFTPGHSYPPDTIHGNIENLDLEDESMDVIICLHVLEHVDDDRKSLSEMTRILKPGGIAVLAFPFKEGELTYEDPDIVDPKKRAKAFGQWDHVRYYGEGAAERISDAGLETKKVTSKDIWSEEVITRWGLLPNEVFFMCKKPGEGSSLSMVVL